MQAKLDKSNIEDIIPLTSMQEGMLFHYIMVSDSLEYICFDKCFTRIIKDTSLLCGFVTMGLCMARILIIVFCGILDHCHC